MLKTEIDSGIPLAASVRETTELQALFLYLAAAEAEEEKPSLLAQARARAGRT